MSPSVFDGDVLNIIGIMNKELQYIFRKFDPVERMIMGRDTGLINPLFGITKGQLINLYYFATCTKDIPVGTKVTPVSELDK